MLQGPIHLLVGVLLPCSIAGNTADLPSKQPRTSCAQSGLVRMTPLDFDSPVVLSLLVWHDAVHSSFKGSGRKGHHLIQDP